MKHKLSKLTSLFLAVAMALAMVFTAVPAKAANKQVDTSATGGHTFTAYEILKGTQATDSNELAVTDWGDGIDSTAFLTEVKTVKDGDTAPFANVTDAKSFADVLANYQDKSDVANAIAKIADKHTKGTGTAVTPGTTQLDAGYYLIKDTTANLTGEDAYNPSVLYLPKHEVVNIESKADVPTVEKKVKDTNDSEANSTTDWQKSADYDIGDQVPYQITGTLPSNFAEYDTYYYKFTDTMSKGLKYTAENARIYAVNGTQRTEITSAFTEDPGTYSETAGTTVTWTCNDLKSIENVTITKGTKIVVEYEAQLCDKAVIGSAGNPNTVNLEFSNNPNNGGDSNHGKTPDKTCIVFTYKVVVDKTDGKSPLGGAAFKLEKKLADGSYTTVKEFTADDITDKPTTFSFEGLDDGTYKLTETITPPGYNTIDPVEFKVVSTKNADDSTSAALTNLNGEKISGNITLTSDKTEGSLTTEVVNEKGSTLPSTGGIGTTIFYVVGGILVAGAAILLITRRRTER